MTLHQYLNFLEIATQEEKEQHYEKLVEANKEWIAFHEQLRNTIERMVPASYLE